MDKSVLAKKTIEDSLYCVLATSLANHPWISPFYFAYDTDYSFYWLSAKDAKHSHNIRGNKDIAITIFNSTLPFGTTTPGMAVYTISEAEEINDPHAIQEIFTFFFKRVPDAKRIVIEKNLM